MIHKIIRTLIRWMPLVLFLLLISLDRNKTVHIIGFLTLLFAYTAILILRILYARDEWHNEFEAEKLTKEKSIDLIDSE